MIEEILMHPNLPAEYQQQPPAVALGGVPPGWTVAYGPDGRAVGYVPAQPPQVVVQVPEQAGMSREMRELVVTVVLILAVVVVCVAAVCAVVVVCGGTLMGIIGAVSAAAVPVGVTLVAAIVAVGWAAQRVKGVVGRGKPR